MSSFDEYIEIQQQLMDRLNSLVIPLIDSAPSGAIEAAIRLNQMSYSPIQESSGLYSNIFASVQERLDSLTNGYASSLATALQNPAILVADFQNILSPDIVLNLDSSTFEESDYVIVNERPMKEICVPDILAIPVGNYRVKIKTGHFISILFGVLSLIVSFILSVPSLHVNQTQKEQIYIQVQQWQGQMLEQLYESIDTSSSTQAETINAIKEIAEAQIKAAEAQTKAAETQTKAAEAQIKAAEAQIKAAEALEKAAEAFQESVDSSQDSADNTSKPEDTDSNK